jgi:hypothetical protein
MSETPPSPLLEQYKAYLQDLGNIGTRYTTANGFYLSVITALLGILALTKAGEVFAASQRLLELAIPTFAILVCWAWWRSVRFYGNLFRCKFSVLRELEKQGGFFPVFQREKELLDQCRPGKALMNDRMIPIFLAVPFLVVLLYLASCWRA